MQVAAVDSAGNGAATTNTGTNPATKSAAASAFGLGFDSLLKIILTQLTYQDPLKPMDNFQFVSQLAQFSQIQLGQTTNDSLSTLVSAQGAVQATGLLGRSVDVSAEGRLLTGRVVGVSLADGTVRLTIKTGDDETISGLALGGVVQVREIN
jgi:flagellar basal-body rod modification protein FlgD